MSDFMRFFPIGHPEAQEPSAHIIQASEGLAMAAVEDPNGPEWKSILFRGEALFDLMKQPGARGISIVPAHNGHHGTVVIFAVDENGDKIVSPGSIAIENGNRCPPFC